MEDDRSALSSDNDESFVDAQGESDQQSGRHKIVSLKHKAGAKTRHAIRSLIHRSPGLHDVDDAGSSIKEDVAFDPSQLEHQTDHGEDTTAGKLRRTAAAAGKAITNPKAAVKRKAVSTIATQDRPYLSEQADHDYIEAHAEHDRALLSRYASDEEGSCPSRTDTKRRILQLEDTRDARKVAWLTSRHISRVAVLQSNSEPQAPIVNDFYWKSAKGDLKLDWQAYLNAHGRYQLKCFALQRMGEVDIRPQQTFNKDVCLKYIERILIASSPIQSWLISLRSLYRYEDPKETLKWAAIWFLIWWVDYVMTFCCCWVIYIVLQSRFLRGKAEHLVETYERSRDDKAKAFRFKELIDQHGSGEWLTPLMDQVGPVAQMQLSDTADFLEILANFYDWRNPSRTWGTLFWFASAVLLAIFSSSQNSMKVMWMFTYLAFFLGRPIASRHPQYRHAVNAFRWIFWDIPTDINWSLGYLKQKAQAIKQDRCAEDPPGEHTEGVTSDTETFVSASSSIDVHDMNSNVHSTSNRVVLESFGVRYHSLQCRLLLMAGGLVIRHASPLKSRRRKIRSIDWHEICEMRKVDDTTAAKMFDLEGIDIVVVDRGRQVIDKTTSRRPDSGIGDTHEHNDASSNDGKDNSDSPDDVVRYKTIRLRGLRDRDLVFNCILGFSGLSFQVLQPMANGETTKPAGDDADHMVNWKDEDDKDAPKATKARRKVVDLTTKVKGKLRRAAQGDIDHASEDETEAVEETLGGGKAAMHDDGMVKAYDPYQAPRGKTFWEGWFV